MESAEDEILKLSGVSMSQIKKRFITIEMDGKPFKVRTFYIGDESQKKTLVMTHGFALASVLFYKMLFKLSQEYRIVMFDHSSWGLNTRLEVSQGLESPELAERWMTDFVERVFEKLQLP